MNGGLPPTGGVVWVDGIRTVRGMQNSRAIRHEGGTAQAGFTLVELMVTVAVLVITSLMVAPSIQRFIAKSEMSALQNDFSQALGRARLQAASLNTCVSLCQLVDGSTTACNTDDASKGQWHRGWMAFENKNCTTPSAALMADMGAADAVTAGYRILYVRQPGNGRFTLESRKPADAGTVLTYNARGLLQATSDTFELRDTRDEALSMAMDLTLNAQGRLMVSKYDPVADAANTAAGNSNDEESAATGTGTGAGATGTGATTNNPDVNTSQGGAQ
jgi:type IV fimbrial biogenesis protein FimT